MPIPIESRREPLTEIQDAGDDGANATPPEVAPDPVIVNPWDHDYTADLPNPWADAPDTSALDPIIVDPWAHQGPT